MWLKLYTIFCRLCHKKCKEFNCNNFYAGKLWHNCCLDLGRLCLYDSKAQTQNRSVSVTFIKTCWQSESDKCIKTALTTQTARDLIYTEWWKVHVVGLWGNKIYWSPGNLQKVFRPTSMVSMDQFILKVFITGCAIFEWIIHIEINILNCSSNWMHRHSVPIIELWIYRQISHI